MATHPPTSPRRSPRASWTIAFCALSAFSLWSACAMSPNSTESADVDIHSFARPDQVRITHLDLDLDLDFDSKRIDGTVELRLDRKDPSAPLMLDTQGLEIVSVQSGGGSPREFALGAAVPELGQPLTIELGPEDASVRVRYRTSPGAQALQWLEPSQTSSKQPFLFTQGQAILTRSWIPLQDTPAVRVTYSAKVRAPLGLTPLMAAERTGQSDRESRFDMPQAIPSYLIALACGRLEHRAIGSRCGVWAEPALVDEAAAEFEDMERMLRSCETLFGEYRWQRYEVLVLPPSFPFGGMENPRLTFCTPTVIAGDKSLVSLIAHELAHSWSGNLVGNATWRDFWLNEGFTVFLENRIMEVVYGPERAQMETLIELRGLAEEMAAMAPGDQVLHIDLADRNPDDGMTSVPYVKGASFLRTLEAHFGRKRFDEFLNSYFAAHSFQAITTAAFDSYLDQHLLGGDAALRKQLRVDEWLYEPGMPDNAPDVRSDAFAAVDAARERYLAGTPASSLGALEWSTQEWLHFLTGLPETLPVESLQRLDRAFNLTTIRNSEIHAAWLELAIRSGYPPADAAAESFLTRVGRRKFLVPLYRAMVDRGDATQLGLARARAIYDLARPGYHAVSRRTLDELVGWHNG